ncbi:hypothetical protein ES319_A11G150100v1 [Gossypium barbadense]|uniref:Uncharacterized protein n=2 Tax=Gossypium TaxID=3633 RepID=A0A5J5TN81_GOSBA|nr:hypothetical protein ES319_A11G150100v1 [Gossypium barbadense]TYG94067.1 hypothetical protein ES288_A11G159500v1 [Gossypium darwinii]
MSLAAQKQPKDLPSLLFSDFMLFCSFLLSHPLYFSYFIFFSPYLFKVFSFLSPLFVTTALLLLAFLTLTPTFFNHGGAFHLDSSPDSKASFLLTAYRTLVETLRSKVDDAESDGFGCFEELEAFKIMFEASTTVVETCENLDDVLAVESQGECFRAVEASIDQGPSFENDGSLGMAETSTTSTALDEKPAEIRRPETNQVKAVVKIFEEFLQEKDGVENLSSKKTDKEVKSLCVESNKGDEQKEEFMRRGSEANKVSDPPKVISADNGFEHAAKAVVNDSPRVRGEWGSKNGDNYNYQIMGSNLGNLGSMRKQKEWKRTLACKLFEERHSHNVAEGTEGMDLLWEAYETDSHSHNKVEMKSSSKKGKKSGNNKDYCYDNDNYDEEYEEESNGQLCCLQALKFSAGKMNLGMGRPNLVKISKALKGIGWLHHVSSRHGKKGYH